MRISIIRIMTSRRMRGAGQVAQMGEKRNTYRILVGKKPLGRPRHRWKDNIKTYLRQNGVVWTRLIRLSTEASGGLL
jgi:hypothetical protein